MLLFTVFGVPCIYYGDEIGMEGYSDPFCRMPFAWDNMDTDILAHYCKLTKIRSTLHVFADSEYKELYADTNCIVYERRKGKETLVVYMNLGHKKYLIKFKGKL